MSFLLINKPEGWTSFDVVAFVRKKMRNIASPPFQPARLDDTSRSGGGGVGGGLSRFSRIADPDSLSGPSISTVNTSATPSSLPLGKGEMPRNRPRVGHAGTLDPFATGLLIVGVGREATKRLDEFKNMPKTYVATIKLGEVSDTYDKTGHISLFPRGSAEGVVPIVNRGSSTVVGTEVSAPTPPTPSSPRCSSGEAGRAEGDIDRPNISEIKKVVNSFKGKPMQIPPMFSAKKINGKKLYELARKGIEIERKASEIEIYKIKILDYYWPFLKIEVQCSAGTYIRSLANDIGAKLGTGAYCEALIRTKIGKYSLKKAVDINSLKFL